ncbi:hypothetical protein CEP54_001673 [Fusarium duplospermum]|uniref:Uncharacterized protein n=1 Tax=Fusarium duplospermum TaxID=1325734 RepID=A0A428QYY2_9HYPO|nr:hypothetical protein CEP54_001673 [Fusarium duplospermum]
MVLVDSNQETAQPMVGRFNHATSKFEGEEKRNSFLSDFACPTAPLFRLSSVRRSGIAILQVEEAWFIARQIIKGQKRKARE